MGTPQKLEEGIYHESMGDKCLGCGAPKPEFKSEGPFWVYVKERVGGFLLCAKCFAWIMKG
jgi:hypothetical protein